MLDMPGSVHSYENQVESDRALLAEFETIKIWNRFVLDQYQQVFPIQSKNLFAGKYTNVGQWEGDIKAEIDKFYHGNADQFMEPMTIEKAAE